MKILLITNDNRLLVDSTGDEGKIIVDNSVELTANDDGMVIKLLKDYENEGNTLVKIEDGEIVYEVDR